MYVDYGRVKTVLLSVYHSLWSEEHVCGKSYPESNNLVAVSRKFYETHFAIQNLNMNIQFSDTLIMVGNCLQICLK